MYSWTIHFRFWAVISVSGFWIKRKTYEEQPVVRFQYQTLLFAATSLQGDYVAWSTFPHLNNMLGTNLRIPAVSVRTKHWVALLIISQLQQLLKKDAVWSFPVRCFCCTLKFNINFMTLKEKGINHMQSFNNLSVCFCFLMLLKVTFAPSSSMATTCCSITT